MGGDSRASVEPPPLHEQEEQDGGEEVVPVLALDGDAGDGGWGAELLAAGEGQRARADVALALVRWVDREDLGAHGRVGHLLRRGVDAGQGRLVVAQRRAGYLVARRGAVGL